LKAISSKEIDSEMKSLKSIYIGLAKEQYDYLFVGCLIVAECLLGYLIILKVPYTEIDWVAYMQEVDFWLDGGTINDTTRDSIGAPILKQICRLTNRYLILLF
jgi:hypothetical protein